MNIEQAKNLKHGDVVQITNLQGKVETWVVNSKVKTWKSDPSKVKISIKDNRYSYIDKRNVQRCTLLRDKRTN